MDVEVVLLTGGASRRMGADKSTVLVGGIPLAERVARAALEAGYPVTVLGRTPLAGCAFQADGQEFQGPAAVLSRFAPSRDYAFVASCDLARFDPRLIDLLRQLVGDCDAAAPMADGHPQPLCALYRAAALAVLRERVAAGERRVRRWLEGLRWRPVPAEEIAGAGVDPRCVRGANTPEELRALLAEDQHP